MQQAVLQSQWGNWYPQQSVDGLVGIYGFSCNMFLAALEGGRYEMFLFRFYFHTRYSESLLSIWIENVDYRPNVPDVSTYGHFSCRPEFNYLMFYPQSAEIHCTKLDSMI